MSSDVPNFVQNGKRSKGKGVKDEGRERENFMAGPKHVMCILCSDDSPGA